MDDGIDTPIVLAVDAMSGDHGPGVVVAALKTFLLQAFPRAAQKSPDKFDFSQHLDCLQALPRCLLVGDVKTLEAELAATTIPVDLLDSHVELVDATDVIGMDELPSKVVRQKPNSSMAIAVDLLKQGRAQACVSAGNTGALMAFSLFKLRTVSGIRRPAIISAIPAVGGHTHLLDLGANPECSPQQLAEFALMGSIRVQAIHGMDQPKVGLLNIGTEATKGGDQMAATDALLRASTLNYIGYVEGNEIYTGKVDVVVTDGFTGNVALKTSEGLATLIKTYIESEFKRNWSSQLAAFAASPLARALQQRLDSRHYNGASFIGLPKVVVKSHGAADAAGFLNAMQLAVTEAKGQVPERIAQQLLAVTQS